MRSEHRMCQHSGHTLHRLAVTYSFTKASAKYLSSFGMSFSDISYILPDDNLHIKYCFTTRPKAPLLSSTTISYRPQSTQAEKLCDKHYPLNQNPQEEHTFPAHRPRRTMSSPTMSSDCSITYDCRFWTGIYCAIAALVGILVGWVSVGALVYFSTIRIERIDPSPRPSQNQRAHPWRRNNNQRAQTQQQEAVEEIEMH